MLARAMASNTDESFFRDFYGALASRPLHPNDPRYVDSHVP